ncbi:hypothetical protein ACP70R_030644 [Stipagrostis hirtigluma subsp. patula]
MATPSQTLILGAVLALYFILATTALYLRVRRLLRAREAHQQRQQRLHHPPPPREPAPPLEPREREREREEEEEPADGGGSERQQQQRRRRRARRKRQQEEDGEGGGGGGDAAPRPAKDAGGREGKREGEAVLPPRPQFPLASVAGALQRRINARYDDLARASEARCLTIEQEKSIMEISYVRILLSGEKGSKAGRKRMPVEPPFPLSMLSCAMKRRIREVYDEFSYAKITEDLVNEFVNCLIDARNELLQRYVNVQRSFKIKKAMLSNPRNYRSSYDRLFEQVCKLETERDNLKKDAAVYNYVQQRLLASAPYKLIMELSAMEMEAPEISFEELLAQEKEDTAFWKPDGKLRSISSK